VITLGNTDWDWAAEAMDLERAAARATGEDQLARLAQAGDHWASAGAYERAIRLLTDVAARSGDPMDAASPVLGYALLMSGREKAGRAVFRAAEQLAADARDWHEFQDIAAYLVRAGRLEQALADLDAALDLVLALPRPDEPEEPDSPLHPYSFVVMDRLKVREQLGRPADEHDRAAWKSLSRRERRRRSRD
jgi:tetratricopeptide (TPR) repeat protein